MAIPEDFKSLLPKVAHEEPYTGPLYWLFSFDPQTAKVTLIHNEDTHPAHHKTHQDMAPEITHPDRVNGFAYKIRGGFRITDEDHNALNDPFIAKRVLSLLRGHTPKDPLPSLVYHHEEPSHVTSKPIIHS